MDRLRVKVMEEVRAVWSSGSVTRFEDYLSLLEEYLKLLAQPPPPEAPHLSHAHATAEFAGLKGRLRGLGETTINPVNHNVSNLAAFQFYSI